MIHFLVFFSFFSTFAFVIFLFNTNKEIIVIIFWRGQIGSLVKAQFY